MSHARILSTGLGLAATMFFVASTAFAAPSAEHVSKTLPGVAQQLACAVPTPHGPLGY